MAGYLNEGDQLGPYTIEKYLGAGGFKSVYRARNNGGTGDAVVALGIPHRREAENITDLEKEFAMTCHLVHPNILRVYAIEHYDDVAFLVMQYAEGRSLSAILHERGPFSPHEALRFVGLICEALAYAHSAHVFHRDIKPDNVIVLPDNTPLLLDFGVARLLSRTCDQASTTAGTMEYMAPEVFLAGASGVNADIWSLGIMFYELLTGMRPFTGQPAEVLNKVLHSSIDEKPLHARGVEAPLLRVLRKMLDKDPEIRYQRVDELATDLETVARRTRLTDDDESRLEVLIRASFSLVNVLSFEERRVLASIRNIAARLAEDRKQPRPVFVWSVSRGLRDADDKLVGSDTQGDPTAALVHAIEYQGDAIYAFLDMHRHYSPVTTRLIRDTARAVRSTRKSLLFISPTYQAPDELRNEMTLAAFQLPDRAQLGPVLDDIAEKAQKSGLSVDMEDETRTMLVRAAMGLTVNEAQRAFRTAAMKTGGLSNDSASVIAEQKRQIIRKSGILEYYHSSDSFNDVGGLEQLRGWFKTRKPIFSQQARYAGLPVPKGILLVGVPGCGKSLSARALAGEWRTPLVRMDVGRIFGSLVGESETNVRRAIQTAEAVSPCILWIDEVEKGFAGSRSDSGGGVSARVFGSFLTWLQDKRSPVFVVATANDLTGIPPEFLRQGRFDEIFFVDLPTPLERETTFRIHLNKRQRNPDNYNLTALSAASEGFSGAEIEQAVISAMFTAFTAGRELKDDDLHAAVTDTYPLAKAQAKRIDSLIEWGHHHARPAN
jgi:serine/threonine protein kinase/ATP-dependent 26S proteasome regulatory subunit